MPDTMLGVAIRRLASKLSAELTKPNRSNPLPASMLLVRQAIVSLLCGGALVAANSRAESETLSQALAKAYTNNPTIRAERARQRATDERLPQALSGWRPTVVASGDAGVRHNGSSIAPSKGTEPAGIAVELRQPVFRGFRTVNETKQAESTVRSGVQQLLAVEQQVLFDTLSAVVDVMRDRRVVELRKKNVRFLAEQLKATRMRLDEGEVTQTDLAQAMARHSLARSNLANAKSDLEASQANYVRLVGHAPGKLSEVRVPRGLPRSLREAIAIAERQNPNVLAALYLEDASRHNIKVAKSSLLPSVSLRAQYQLRHDPLTSTRSSESATIAGEVTVPLYQAGRVYSEVREAKHVASQRRLQIIEATRGVRENVVRAWHALAAARQTIRSLTDQVRANQMALDGVRQEALAGSRTTLDILDAENELVNSQIAIAGARRDRIVAAYFVLASIGRMTARHLRLPVSVYVPGQHYEATRGRLFGTDADTIK